MANGTKVWYLSKGVVGSIITGCVAVVVTIFGFTASRQPDAKPVSYDTLNESVEVVKTEQGDITEIAVGIIGIISSIIALVGRLKAKTELVWAKPVTPVILMLFMLSLAGCSRAQLDSDELALARAKVDTIISARDGCLAGNNDACARVAEETYRYLVWYEAVADLDGGMKNTIERHQGDARHWMRICEDPNDPTCISGAEILTDLAENWIRAALAEEPTTDPNL